MANNAQHINCNRFFREHYNTVINPSVICLSVRFVRPNQPVEIFGNVSMPFGTLAIRWHPGKILQSPWEPHHRGG